MTEEERDYDNYKLPSSYFKVQEQASKQTVQTSTFCSAHLQFKCQYQAATARERQRFKRQIKSRANVVVVEVLEQYFLPLQKNTVLLLSSPNFFHSTTGHRPRKARCLSPHLQTWLQNEQSIDQDRHEKEERKDSIQTLFPFSNKRERERENILTKKANTERQTNLHKSCCYVRQWQRHEKRGRKREKSSGQFFSGIHFEERRGWKGRAMTD